MIIRAVFMQIEYIFRRPYAVRRRACYPARIAAPFAARVQIFKRNALPVISADNSYGGRKSRFHAREQRVGTVEPFKPSAHIGHGGFKRLDGDRGKHLVQRRKLYTRRVSG